MQSVITFPKYVNLSIGLIGMYVAVIILYHLQHFFLPVLFAAMIAMSVNPVVNLLMRWGLNRFLAIMVVVLISIVLLASLLFVIALQVQKLANSSPELIDRFTQIFEDSILWFSGYFNFSRDTIIEWLEHSKAQIVNQAGGTLADMFNAATGLMAGVLLIPVYVVMMLLYQDHIMEFINRLFGLGNTNLSEIILQSKKVIQKYLAGLSVEIGLVAVMNTVGLLILGIEYAILLGISGAFLNLIPYLGGVVAVFLYMIVALVTKGPLYMLYVLILYGLIQFLDNNIIVPKVVGSIVQLNALTSLFAVILGAALWGIPGMFVSIPLAAILKIIFDHMESLKPVAFLMGNPPRIKPKENSTSIVK
jgi:predicted PurR-regulated permease PerM